MLGVKEGRALTLSARCRWAGPQDGRQRRRQGWAQCTLSGDEKCTEKFKTQKFSFRQYKTTMVLIYI